MAAQATEAAEREASRLEPHLPLRIALATARQGEWAPSSEVAYLELNLANARDRRRQEVLLVSTEDGGPMGSAVLSLRCASALRPYLAVRRAFVSLDSDGSGSLSTGEARVAMRKAGVLADARARLGWHGGLAGVRLADRPRRASCRARARAVGSRPLPTSWRRRQPR